MYVGRVQNMVDAQHQGSVRPACKGSKPSHTASPEERLCTKSTEVELLLGPVWKRVYGRRSMHSSTRETS